MNLIDEIKQLKKEKKALILAHNYELGEVQDIADFVGDSLALARYARAAQEKILVMAGVYFMAETASILSPDKKVLIPDINAGCSLANSINVEQLRAWKKGHPNAVVVSYVNTSAAVKAESDYCCTSSNAVSVVESIPREQEILFLPDMFLGSHVKRMTQRDNIHIWMGECHVHAAIHPEVMAEELARHPKAELLVHPECGCTTKALTYPQETTHILSTDGMLKWAKESPKETFIVATEVGLLHRLRQENPQKNFIAASNEAVCPFMKMITLANIRDALYYEQHVVKVPDEMAQKAYLPIERMVQISSHTPA